jgi:alpha-mannosidase
MQKLAMKVNTTDTRFSRSVPFIVFNPCSFPVRAPIDIEMHRLVHYAAPVLRDDQGNLVDYQEIRTASVKEFMERLRVLFIADLPAMGYRIFRFDFDGKPAVSTSSGTQAGEWFLENSLVKVSFDRQTGYISSYYDKQKNRELVKDHAAVPIVLEDTDDTWGHRIVSYDQEIGRFSNPKFIHMENGPERARIQIEYTFGNSKLYQDFSLHRGSAILNCKVTTDWYEHKRVLKLGFATGLKQGHLTYSIPYGYIERKQNGEEEPGQAWIDLSGADASGPYGIAVINNGVCGYSAHQGEIRMTLLHSTAWCHHNPQVVEEGDGYRFMEQGRHELDYQMVPHEGDWRQGRVVKAAESFLTGPIVHLTTNHRAHGAGRDSLFTVDAANVSLSCVKLSEEDKALIVRCVELNGESARGTIRSTIKKEAIPLSMRPCEIKTIRIPLRGNQRITEVNLLESPVR